MDTLSYWKQWTYATLLIILHTYTQEKSERKKKGLGQILKFLKSKNRIWLKKEIEVMHQVAKLWVKKKKNRKNAWLAKYYL